MKRLLLTSVLVLAGCSSGKPSEADYLDVVRQTVRFAEDDARSSAPPGSATGPLLLDVKSFRGGSLRAIGEVVDTDRIAGAVDRPFQATVPDSSFNCMDMELGTSCWVPKNGVFVHLNLASRAPDRITMHYTSTVTASNFVPPVLCDRAFRLEFVRGTGGWVMQDTVPLRAC
ncbi:MAG TPA: hypothetical protein VHG35_17380 [Gemmatimonadales bacterium]|nr:hypothetical protein [Gemmatimonadales bacterium]